MITPKLLLIIGPTAVGKSSIIERALSDHPKLCDIITYTSRAMRAGEREGQPYHFVSKEKFRELIERGFFIEWALVHGNLYGTPRDQVDVAAQNGRVVCIDIDVQGAAKMLTLYPDAVTIFLMPPSIDALKARFIKRGITSEEDLARRLESARVEMSRRDEFKHVIVNDDLDVAYAEIQRIITAL